MTAPARNVWEEAADDKWLRIGRAAKVARLVSVIDAALDASKILLPEQRLDAVAGMGSVGWASASAQAGGSFPSLEAQWDVVRVYEGRVRASVDAQIAASIAASLRASVG